MTEVLKCRFGCDDPVYGLFYAPDGCWCYPDKIQALCRQHAIKGIQNNEMYELMIWNEEEQTKLRKVIPDGNEIERLQDWIWPKDDDGCWLGPVSDWVNQHSQKWFTHVKDKKLVVQAGGACGVYPRMLADIFEQVYTFEPISFSFYCLTQNCRNKENIFKFQAALGAAPSQVDMHTHNIHNVGAHALKKLDDPDYNAHIPMMTIDSLGLPRCDLIALDIEEHEFDAIRGGVETIKKYKPVVVLENGMKPQIVELMNSLGYHFNEASAADTVWFIE